MTRQRSPVPFNPSATMGGGLFPRSSVDATPGAHQLFLAVVFMQIASWRSVSCGTYHRLLL